MEGVIRGMENLRRSDIRKFLFEAMNSSVLSEGTIDVAGMKVGFDNEGIIIGDNKFSLTALTLFGDYEVKINNIEKGEDESLIIAGSTEIKDVSKPLPPEKLAQIKKEVSSGKAEFVIPGKLADVRFNKIS
jgi:hypothetical protein